MLTVKEKAINDEPIRILAIDVGVGTQDILLYDTSKNEENSIKLVLPSATQILACRIRNSKSDLFLKGTTMGGGPISMAIANHIKKGYKVTMTEESARTIRDNLDEVRDMGVKIVKGDNTGESGIEVILTRDVDFYFLKQVFEGMEERFKFDCMGIAVQDHGYSDSKPDRIFRFEKIKEVLDKGTKLSDFGYFKPPAYFTRMNAVLKIAKEHYAGKVLIFDTKIAAIAGALHGIKERPALSIDVGNGHTLAGVVGEGNVAIGMFEHHTAMLTREKLEDILVKFVDGELMNEDVYKDGGHGCHIREKVGFRNIERILVTGPNRRILENSDLEIEFANPIGDVMMTGPIGMVDMIIERMESSHSLSQIN